MIRSLSVALLFWFATLGSASGQVPTQETAAASASKPAGPLYHVIGEPATLFSRPDSTRPYLEISFREPVYLLEKGPRWTRVKTRDGVEGYLRSHTISNRWIRVSKKRQKVYLYEGTKLLVIAPADFGYNAFSDKERRGGRDKRDHWRTPEGTFYVVKKNPHSRFYRALVLNYPTAKDAERGLQKGWITAEEHRAIVRAQENLEMPPMDTELGGWIEIHGDGTGSASNWTHGCVAIHNRYVDRIWNRIEVGTPVLIN